MTSINYLSICIDALVDLKVLNMIYFGVIFSALKISRGQDFGYEGDKGPSHWGEQYNTCFGKYQSPIDINSLTVKHAQLPPLQFHDLITSVNQTTIKNNGHTVMISVDSDQRPSISGGPLSGTYEFSQLHFHWGENDTMGSEDLIDGHSFPMELHMVFYKKQYRNIRSAMENSDGLTVLAFFFNLDDVDNPHYVELAEILPEVSQPNTSAQLTRVNSITDFILPNLDEYYTYHGSLTTPPCSEVVTWIDFKQSIPLSHKQIEAFRSIQDNEGHHLTHNFRPIQPTGDRDVFFVTSSPLKNDEALEKGGLEEPLQELELSNSDKKQTTSTVSTALDDNDEIDSHVLAHREESNDLTVETTTISHKKSHKSRKNCANNVIKSTCWLVVGASLPFFPRLF